MDQRAMDLAVPTGGRLPEAPLPASSLGRALLGFSGDTLALVVLTLAIAFVAVAPLVIARVELDAQLLPVMALSFAAMGLAAWPFWRRTRTALQLQPLRAAGPSLAFAAMVGLAAFATGVGRGWLEPHLVGDVPEPSNIAPILAALSSQPWLAMALFVLVGPWVEELALRRVLFGRMLVRGWPWLGLLLTTTLFAWLHEPVPRDGLGLGQWLWLLSGYWLMGALFAWVYWRTRRLSAAFVAHAVNNVLACGMLMVG